MKKVVLNICLVLFVATANVKAQAPGEAVEYMNQMGNSFTELKDETWKYLKAVTRGQGARRVEKKRQQLVQEVRAKKNEVGKMKGFYSDISLKNAVLGYLDMNYIVLTEDFEKILNMEDIAEQSYDLMEAYILAKEKANEKLEDAGEVLDAAQKEFAAAHDITIIEAEMDKKSQRIEQAGNALAYYNDVYLIFFKAFKQEAYVLDAMNRADVNAMEQNINVMLSYSEECQAKLDTLARYNGDGALRAAAGKVIQFYKAEAEKDFPGQVDFYLKKDNFEKQQKIFDAKGKKSRTQEDVDNFNNAVSEFNAAVASFNATNERINKQRSELLESWNKSVDVFFNKHTN